MNVPAQPEIGGGGGGGRGNKVTPALPMPDHPLNEVFIQIIG